MKKPSVKNVADYISSVDDDNELIEIILALATKNDEEGNSSSKEENTAVDTFHNQLEADKVDDIFFANASSQINQDQGRRPMMHMVSSKVNVMEMNAVSKERK